MIKRVAGFLRRKAGKAKRKTSQRLLVISRSLKRDKRGINLVGYFSYTFGVAEVGRFFANYLAALKIPYDIFVTDSAAHKKLDPTALAAYEPHFTLRPAYHKNIYFINADQITLWRSTAPTLFLGRYNAAVFFWEFNDYFNFPAAFDVLDEVIGFTDFIVTALKKAAPPGYKVTKFPLPFSQNWVISQTPEQVRSTLRLAKDEYVFIFNFDFLSVYQRKNPEAILAAFEIAFKPGDNVRLILKTIHSEQTSDSHDSFVNAVAGMEMKNKLLLIDENLGRNEFMSMINASDCYISLHRSEGLGLGMLEAMSMGKPVIGTDFGGNTDFMNEKNSLPVAYSLTPAGSNAAPYKEGWLWAEPDVQQAASFMRKLYDDREYAELLGQRGKASVEEQYSLANFNKFLVNWMND